MSNLSLSPLFIPRSVRIYGRPRPKVGLSCSTPRVPRPKSGVVDLGIVFPGSSTQTARWAHRAAEEAWITLVLGSPVDGWTATFPDREDPLVLGPGSGIWTPRVTAGINAGVCRPRSRRPVFIITQSCKMAEIVIEAARRRGVHLGGALSTGCDTPLTWDRIARVALELPGDPLLLIALHRPVPYSQIISLAKISPKPVLMITQSARYFECLPFFEQEHPSEIQSVTSAMGIPMVQTPSELAEIAFLLNHGLKVRTGSILAASATSEEAVLLDQALYLAGLRGVAPSPNGYSHPNSPSMQQRPVSQVHLLQDINDIRFPVSAGSTAVPVDGVLLAKEQQIIFQPSSPDHITARGNLKSLIANHATLPALAALQRCYAPELQVRPKINIKRAYQLLDHWPTPLGEIQTKELLSCYGLYAPQEQLVNSASSAAQVSTRLGFPVVLKPVGPTLRNRRDHAAIALDVQHASACRQAFRDVLCACSNLCPTPLLDGVLVSQMINLPFWLDCSLVWLEEIILLKLVKIYQRRETRPSLPPLVLACPCSPLQARQSAQMFFAGQSCSHTQISRLATFITNLSWMGPDLVGRMHWLRLDTVSLPTAQQPPLVLDARGLQREPTAIP